MDHRIHQTLEPGIARNQRMIFEHAFLAEKPTLRNKLFEQLLRFHDCPGYRTFYTKIKSAFDVQSGTSTALVSEKLHNPYVSVRKMLLWVLTKQ